MLGSRRALWGAVLLLGACAAAPPSAEPTTPARPARPGGRIIVAGERVPLAARVITFLDPGGYDGRSRRCRFTPDRVLPSHPAPGCATPSRYGRRPADDLAAAVRDDVAVNGWTRESLRARISQVIFHYDVCGTSSRCFEVLHDVRGLSCHFLVDVDGTIYQTLDLVARARHAGIVNDMSIGVEIAHMGAYPPGDRTLDRYYRNTADGLELALPESFRPPVGRFAPARPGMFAATVNGREVVMPDYTEEQYRALTALVDALAREFPRLRRRTPRDARGAPLQHALPEEERRAGEGFYGHHHVSEEKTDPGPAFDWDRVLRAR